MTWVEPQGRTVTTLVPGRVYRVGGFVELDGRVSWAPRRPGRWQPINAYVVLDYPRPVLIDTGPAAVRDEVIDGIRTILTEREAPTAFLTRAELDCAGNLRDIHRVVSLAGLVTGGMANPFDSFDMVAGWADVFNQRQVLAQTPGANTMLGESRALEILPPPIRVLATYWVYDQISRTLFTSDSFGYTDVPSEAGSVLINQDDYPMDDAVVRSHVLAKFGWLALADTEPIVTNLLTVFSSRPVETIAPTHGCVLSGASVVRRNIDRMIDLLREVGVRK